MVYTFYCRFKKNYIASYATFNRLQISPRQFLGVGYYGCLTELSALMNFVKYAISRNSLGLAVTLPIRFLQN